MSTSRSSTDKTIAYEKKLRVVCARLDQRQCARAYTQSSSRCMSSVFFRLALIVVAGWMPPESPSSSRGPPLLACSPRCATRFRAFHVEDCSTTLVQSRRRRGELGNVGGVRSSYAQTSCPFTSPVRSSNVFRRGLWRGLRDYDHLSLSLARVVAFYLSCDYSPSPTPSPPSNPFPPAILCAAYPSVFRSVAVDFFLLSVSFSVSHRYLLPTDEDKLCSCLSRLLRRRLGHAKRRPSLFSFSLWVSRGINVYHVKRIPVGFSDSPLAFCFISLASFRFLYVRLPLSDS